MSSETLKAYNILKLFLYKSKKQTSCSEYIKYFIMIGDIKKTLHTHTHTKTINQLLLYEAPTSTSKTTENNMT